MTKNEEHPERKPLDHVLRRFYRVGTHRDRKDGGVGLGLSLVRAIARAHDGEARIESSLGQGTRVVLEFSSQS